MTVASPAAVPRLVVLDATNWGHMLWHASQGHCQLPEAILHRCRVLREAWGCYRAVACFDQGPSFRHLLEPTYKAQRPPADEALRAGLRDAAEHLRAEGMPVLAGEQLEADDWIASVCHAAVAAGCQAIIVSADKDVRQCLREGQVSLAYQVTVQWGQPQTRWLTAASLQERWGVRPDQWIDYQALVGDRCDGIRGAEGIGPKTAARLLTLAGSLDRLLAAPDGYTANRKELAALREFRERAALVRRLVALRTDGPFAADVL
jgi:DNA polymerase-1